MRNIFFHGIFLYSVCITLFNLYKCPFYYETLKSTRSIDDIYNGLDMTIYTKNNSKHFWGEFLEDKIHKKIDILNEEIMNILGDKQYDYIPSMTELYYSSQQNINSDNQYVSNHYDGPFFPCKVYRAIVGIHGNNNTDSHFPKQNLQLNLKKYEIVIFDYNNEPHYIETNNHIQDFNQRVVLKLHFIKKDSIQLCKKLHCRFGRETRDLFETNKQQLYLSGLLAKASLLCTTHRKYILVMIWSLYYYSLFTKYIIPLFMLFEVIGILYVAHFYFQSIMNHVTNI